MIRLSRPCRRKRLPIAACAVALLLGSDAAGQSGDIAAWAGVWKGTLVNLPLRPDAAVVDVTMEIGTMPAADNTCTTWRTTYAETGTVRMVKDYRLCRGTGASDLSIDEGNGVRLKARWLGDVLVSPFKVGETLLVMTMRLRDGILEEEILTVVDQAAGAGVVALEPQGIQRLTFRRVDGSGQSP